jgi:hypothetical protein
MYTVTIRTEGAEMVARDDQGNKRAWGGREFAKPGMTALEIAAQIFHREEIATAKGTIESGVRVEIKEWN